MRFANLICMISAILAYHAVLGQQITLPLTGGSNTDPGMVASPRINLSLFSSQSSLVKAMADIHDRFATYLFDRAAKLGCEAASLAAIIYVESGGKGFSGSRMIIRFENHVFRPRLNNDALFYDHFTYNTDQTWTGHTWRASTSDAFQTFHGNQDKEWTVLQFAQGLNDLAALESASYGAPQIMGFNAQSIGYANARAMFLAFSNSLEKQMDGMIEFIKGRTNCLAGLRNNDFVQFAGCYNGAGQAQAYGANILGARNAYLTVLNVLNIVPPTTCQFGGLYGVCGTTSSCEGEAYSGVAVCGSEQCCISRISCKPSGQPEGSCMDQARCLSPGQLFSGLCPGGSTIKCCVGGPTSPPTTRSPTAAATSTPTTPVPCTYEGLSGQCLASCSGPNVRGYADSECIGGGTQCCVPAQVCTPAPGLSGTCLDSSVCSGATFSGFCPGSSAIRCCVPTSTPTLVTHSPTATTKSPTAITKSPTIATKQPTKTLSPAQQPSTRSPTFVSCTIDDGLNTGECKDVSLCNGAFSPFPGFCPGPANIQCCVSSPVKTRSPTFALTSSPTTSCTYEGLTGYCSASSSCAASFQAYSIASSGSCAFCCAPSPTCSQSGRCMDTSICPSGSTILSGLCPGSSKIKCCKPSSLLSSAEDNDSGDVSSSTVAVGVSIPVVVIGALAMAAVMVRSRRKQQAALVDNSRWSVIAHPKEGTKSAWQQFAGVASASNSQPTSILEGDNPLFVRQQQGTMHPPGNINV